MRHKAGMGMRKPESRIQHRNLIVASFRAAECEIQTGTDSSLALEGGDLSKNLRVPIPPPGSSHDPMIYKRTSGSQIRPHGLGEPSGPEYDLRIQGELPGSSTTFESSDDPRVPTQPPGYVISLQTPRVHILA
ncbi:hypothetical protein DY000_02040781 [Brassica cretica]|uniref:Uncharacterized protein n=1 Tax=Brassica cretica TaxID=69181 RepID=A0ABQ7BQM9_BRACR|nr:hypothetical protein DY000_02040781 [Brassica cretica]